MKSYLVSIVSIAIVSFISYKVIIALARPNRPLSCFCRVVGPNTHLLAFGITCLSYKVIIAATFSNPIFLTTPIKCSFGHF